ncbi:MAG: N-acetylmuramoyl-L-alanine amidase [Oscillospiraceae bacterium]
MPNIYLSPSVQQGNLYVTGGTEESAMNRIADAMEPYLRASGIIFTRNTPEMTVSQIIRQSNAGNYGLHLALHSNAAPEGRYGQKQGVEVYYFPESQTGKTAASIIADTMKTIYPNPSLVSIKPTTSLGEVDRTRAPSVLVEIAYHDNPQDADWITGNIQPIARALVRSLTEYFDIPFVEPQTRRAGRVITRTGPLHVRSRPNVDAPILADAPRGAQVVVLGNAGDGWLVVSYNGVTGYAAERYIKR